MDGEGEGDGDGDGGVEIFDGRGLCMGMGRGMDGTFVLFRERVVRMCKYIGYSCGSCGGGGGCRGELVVRIDGIRRMNNGSKVRCCLFGV